MQNLKEKIKNELLTKQGKLNSAILRREWFIQSDFYKEIHFCTSFLDSVEPSFSERVYCILNDINHILFCPICNKNRRVFLPNFGKGYSETCNSRKCIQHNPKTRQTRNNTMLQTYGALVSPKTLSSFKERIPKLLQKTKTTLVERYGVDNPSKIQQVKEKVQSKLKQYRTSEEYLKKKEIKRLDSLLKNISNKIDIKHVYDPDSEHETAVFRVSYKCKTCFNEETVAFNTLYWRQKNCNSVCNKCAGIDKSSNLQIKIYEFIKQIESEVILNYRIPQTKKDVDIFIPNKNIGFEINGLYWHSFNYKESSYEKKKHLIKTEECLKRGIKLFHIFENEYTENNEIVESRIRSILGHNHKIYARICEVRSISPSLTKLFLEQNHIQGSISSSLNYGLYYKNELVALMTFGKSRYDKSVDFELYRYCSKLGVNVIGGASKLFSAFLKHSNPNSVVSYCDRRWGTGKLYEALNFKFVKNTEPNYFYVKSSKLYSRLQFQKHKLKDVLSNYNSALTESENMFNNGYRRLWDCGNSKWVWNKS